MDFLNELGLGALALSAIDGIDTTRVVRVASELGDRYSVIGNDNNRSMVSLAGALREARPGVGDFVELNPEMTRIDRVLPRRSAMKRQAAGLKTREQVIAANIDIVFIVSSMNDEFNESRLERYVAVAWESGATPVIVLNKADLAEDPDDFVDRAERCAVGVDVVSLTAVSGAAELERFLAPGRTFVLVGSSGVGKSTIVNALVGSDVQDTGAIREDDDEGRHTTTRRDLIVLGDGRGVLIDTPGMRELQLWDASEGIGTAFQDVEAFARGCRFRDCQHDGEPGCAVLDALQSGDLDERRFDNYQKLLRENAYHERKRDVAAARAEYRRMGKMYRAAAKKKSR